MKEARLRYLRINEYRKIRESVKIAKILFSYEIPELKITEESKVEEPEIDLKTS